MYKQLDLFEPYSETASSYDVLLRQEQHPDAMFVNVQRQFEESRLFQFSAPNRITSPRDVAYIFKQLETAAVENAFAVLVKDGRPTVIHLSMGTINSCPVEVAAIRVADKRLHADEIYFVHNHPSGKIVASIEDQKVWAGMVPLFGDRLQPGIIINTRSGKYGLFDDETPRFPEQENLTAAETPGLYPIKTYSFSKQVFEKDYLQTPSVFCSEDVAAFLSSHRLGERKKFSYLVLAIDGTIRANVHTTYTKIDSGNIDDVCRKMTEDISIFGGSGVITYGTVSLGRTIVQSIREKVELYSMKQLSLMDHIDIRSEVDMENLSLEIKYQYMSSVDEGWLREENLKYTPARDSINEQFNAELDRQIAGTLPKGHVYRLGMPSTVLQSAGIPDLPMEMASARLLHKSNQENHPFDLSEIKNLPQAVQNPLAVFRSATRIGSNVILTELVQGDKNFVVAIETNRSGGKILVNSIRSIHPRTTSNIISWINEGLMDYADQARVSQWIEKKKKLSRNTFSSAPADAVKRLNSAAKIVKVFQNPVLQEQTRVDGEDLTKDIQRESADRDVTQRFNAELDRQIAGTLPKGHVYRLGTPSEFLLSAGIPNLPIELPASQLAYKATSGKHDFDLSEIKGLPIAIAHPIATFSYGDKNKAQNILTMLEHNGEKFLVGMFIRPDVKGKIIEINSIRNIFPKHSLSIVSWINQGKLTNVAKKKLLNFLDQQRTNYADVAFVLPEKQVKQERSEVSKRPNQSPEIRNQFNHATKIVKNFQNPRLEPARKIEIPLKINGMVLSEDQRASLKQGGVIQVPDKVNPSKQISVKIGDDKKTVIVATPGKKKHETIRHSQEKQRGRGIA